VRAHDASLNGPAQDAPGDGGPSGPKPLRLLLVGHGRMGRLIESLAPAHGFTVAGVLERSNNRAGEAITPALCGGVDVAVDFSIAQAVPENVPRLAANGVNVVIGTTGWQAEEARVRAAAAGVGVVAAANFSLGVHLFRAVVAEAARRFAPHAAYGAWIHESHHAAKKDAPSGTALWLQKAMAEAGYAHRVDVSSTRAGSIPGTHAIGFDGPFEGITLTHAARDRATFAVGALTAARWLVGRRGWFGMEDVIDNRT
jgi:4-hydroxy-tetrahydrodipicolinate reductase